MRFAIIALIFICFGIYQCRSKRINTMIEKAKKNKEVRTKRELLKSKRSQGKYPVEKVRDIPKTNLQSH